MMYCGAGGFERALAEVGIIRSLSPTIEEIRLVEFILSEAVKNPVKVAEAVCRAALQWRDRTAWTRVVLTCCTTQGLATLPERNVFSAVKLFDFEDVKPAYVPWLISGIPTLIEQLSLD